MSMDLYNAKVEAMAGELREERRIKWLVDYAVTFKYGQYHLLCSQVFQRAIVEVAAKHGVTFTTTHTYT